MIILFSQVLIANYGTTKLLCPNNFVAMMLHKDMNDGGSSMMPSYRFLQFEPVTQGLVDNVLNSTIFDSYMK